MHAEHKHNVLMAQSPEVCTVLHLSVMHTINKPGLNGLPVHICKQKQNEWSRFGFQKLIPFGETRMDKFISPSNFLPPILSIT